MSPTLADILPFINCHLLFFLQVVQIQGDWTKTNPFTFKRYVLKTVMRVHYHSMYRNLKSAVTWHGLFLFKEQSVWVIHIHTTAWPSSKWRRWASFAKSSDFCVFVLFSFFFWKLFRTSFFYTHLFFLLLIFSSFFCLNWFCKSRST